MIETSSTPEIEQAPAGDALDAAPSVEATESVSALEPRELAPGEKLEAAPVPEGMMATPIDMPTLEADLPPHEAPPDPLDTTADAPPDPLTQPPATPTDSAPPASSVMDPHPPPPAAGDDPSRTPGDDVYATAIRTPAPIVDPDYARILAMADKFGLDPRDIIAAGQLLSDQGMANAEILATLEKRYADATPKIPAGTVLVLHGTYCGPGCPDRHARKRPQDNGFAYDAHHPAQPGEVIVGLPERDAKRLIARKSFQAVG